MSTLNYEQFHQRLRIVRAKDGSLGKLFDENTLKDSKKIKWLIKSCVEYNDMITIEFLLSQGITMGILNEQNQTAIHIAAYYDRIKTINLLFAHYGDSVNYIDKNGLSHFHAACLAGNIDVVEHFLNSGVDINYGFFSNESSILTPLYLAVKFQQLEIVKLLLKYGADPNPVNSKGTSPLHMICKGDVEQMSLNHSLIYFINSGQNDFNDYETLKTVKQNYELEMAKILIEYGGKVNITNWKGDTPMNYIFKHDYLKNIKSIEPLKSFEYYIQNLRERQQSKIKLLLSNGADARIANNNGDTVLHLVIKHIKEVHRLKGFDAINFEDNILANEIVKFLEHGADVNAKNNGGQSPLQLTVALLYLETVKSLLDYNADGTSIKFDCFQYKKAMIPCLQATDTIIKIVNAIENKGFHLNQRNNLNILKFFVSNYSKYTNALPIDRIRCTGIKYLLEFGTDVNVRIGLEKFLIRKDLKSKMSELISTYLTILENGNLYASQEIKDYLRFKIYYFASIDSYITSKMIQEIKDMEVTKLNMRTSLLDIITTRPRHCYFRIKNCDYISILISKDFQHKFCNTLGIIEGHFTKILVRWYIEKSARNYLATLIKFRLPELCCDKIFDYLSNESLFNLCVAGVGVAKAEN